MLHFPLTRTDGLILLMLLIAGLKFTFGLEQAIDITLYDESTYLWQGVTLPSRGFDQANYDLLYAPLYTLWYYLLSLLAPNRLDLYYLNFKLMMILPGSLIYLLLRAKGVSVLLSVIVAWFFLMSTAISETVPKVSHLALLIMLLVLILSHYTQSRLEATLVAAGGALLISYCRPEYLLTFLLLSLLLVGQLVSIYQEFKTFDQVTLEKLILGIALIMLLFVSFGSPVGGGRSLWAFQQHFAVNWVTWTENRELNPWTDASHIFTLNFGSADSILAAFMNNPSAFFKHLSYNSYHVVAELLDVWFSPRFLSKDTVSKMAGILLVISLYIIHAPRVYKNIFKYQWFLILSSAYLFSALVSVILIYPRAHYLLVPGVLIGVMVIILLTDAMPAKSLTKPQLLFYLLASLMTPSPYLKKLGTRTHLDAIRWIASLKVQKPVNMLESQGGYCYYLGEQCQWVSVFDKKTDFKQFLAHKHINMILLTTALNSDTKFRDDPEWQFFVNNFRQFGFTLRKSPKFDGKLLIHTSLLY